jgi:protein-disulfide isomerase
MLRPLAIVIVLVVLLHESAPSSRYLWPRSFAGDSTPPSLAARTRGAPSASLTIYELSDFQCPFCRDFAIRTLPVIDSIYIKTGRVRWSFINDPKTRAHPNAFRAAEYADCAATLGHFWQYHDVLFAHQDDWAYLRTPDQYFESLANSAQIDQHQLKSCVDSGHGTADLQADLRYVSSLGERGVPNFVVNGRMVAQGALPIEQFVAIIDSLLRISR